ncbi:MAG: hypothetical protein GY759_03520 [Chloroflexi bacterium]|nr:hypothetical protein [Chloroflexota bacterium]
MYDNNIYAGGVHSAMRVQWALKCETPLALRNGIKLSYSENTQPPKTRGRGLKLQWRSKQGSDFEVAGLYYGYEIEGNQVVAYHLVPASSVRGALRSWTIRHLVHPQFRDALSPPPNDDQDKVNTYIDALSQAFQERHYGYELIASLFGLATDTRSRDWSYSNAGRLSVDVKRFDRVDARTVDAGGPIMQANAGPDNVRRNMHVRNPLDRLTHASKEGGLHHFLEFSRGEVFHVHLQILNPQESDIAMLGLWVREMNDGMLRFGALSSIGRGRVSVSKQSYNLWRRQNAPALAGFEHFLTDAGSSEMDDALAGIWLHHSLPPGDLEQFEAYLDEYTGDDGHA